MAGIAPSSWAAGVQAVNGCNSNDPGAPCFAQVSDILSGKKHLLRQDDLVVTTTATLVSPGFSQTAIANLYSTNSTLTFNNNVPWTIANYAANNFQTAVGRMFNLPNNVVATFAQTFTALGVNLYDPGTGTVAFTPAQSQLAFGASLDGVVMADFTGDGYAELATLFSTPADLSSSSLAIARTADVTNVGAGLTFGPASSVNPISSMTAGDFNGDGQDEIALVACPQGACVVQILSVDPASLVISRVASITLPGISLGPASLAAGRFGATSHDQLAVVYPLATGTGNAIVATIDFDASLQPSLKASYDTGIAPGGFVGIQMLVKTVRLVWSAPNDYAILVVAAPGRGNLSILTFSMDGNLTPSTVGPGLPLSGFACATDVAVGNFNQTVPNPSPPPATSIDLDLEIALLYPNTCTRLPSSVAVTLYGFKVPPGSARLHQPFMIRASHRYDAGPGFDSILSLFYDGDPEKGGVLFDQEIISDIRASESFVTPASFRPGTCGKHRIFVQSVPGDGSVASVTRMATIHVTADLQAELDSLSRAIKAAKFKRGKELSLLAQVKVVQWLLVQGLNEAARYFMVDLKREIRALSGKTLPSETAAQWIEEAALVIGCIKH